MATGLLLSPLVALPDSPHGYKTLKEMWLRKLIVQWDPDVSVLMVKVVVTFGVWHSWMQRPQTHFLNFSGVFLTCHQHIDKFCHCQPGVEDPQELVPARKSELVGQAGCHSRKCDHPFSCDPLFFFLVLPQSAKWSQLLPVFTAFPLISVNFGSWLLNVPVLLRVCLLVISLVNKVAYG